MHSIRGIGLALVGLVVITMAGLVAGGTVNAQENVTYTVTIENLTSGQPFTPPVVVAHSDQLDLFEVGQAASEEVRQIAENGDSAPLLALVEDSADVFDSVAGDAPIMPGETATFMIDAPAGSLLSIVSMLICTNDGFTGVDAWALPASGSETVDSDAYDAGSEQNTEDFADIVPPCQGLIGVTSDDEGTGMSNPALAEGGVITMHAGIQGNTDLTVDDHGWTGPVARITVSAEAPVDAPTTGVGPADADGASTWFIYLAIGGAALVLFGGTTLLARQRMTR